MNPTRREVIKGIGVLAALAAAPTAKALSQCVTTSDFDFSNYNIVRTKNTIPVPSIANPGYLGSFIDPNFGTRITRITGNRGSPIPVVGGTWGRISRHLYSTVPVWNADQQLLFIGRGVPVPLWLDGTNYNVLFTRTPPAGGIEARWHPKLPDIMVNLGQIGGALVVQHWNVRTTALTTKFSTTSYSNPTLGGWGTVSNDGSKVAIVATRNSDSKFVAFVINIDAGTKGPDIDLAANGVSTCEPTTSSGGNYIIVDGVISGYGDVNKCFNASTGAFLSFVSAYGEPSHSDPAYTPSGVEVYVGVSKSTGRLLARDPVTNVGTFCSPTGFYPNSASRPDDQDHTSCQNYKRPGWAYSSEIEALAWKLDGSMTVNRFCHHHSTIGEYDAQPQICPSPDGKRLVFASDWGIAGGTISTYVCDIAPLQIAS